MRLQLCVARQVAALAKMEWLSRAALPARFGDPGRHHRRRNGGAGARRLPAGRRGAARRHRGLLLARCRPGAAAARGAQHHDALERCRRVLTSNLVLGAAKRTCAGLSLRPHFMARRPLLQRLVSSRPRTRPRGAPPRPSPTTAHALDCAVLFDRRPGRAEQALSAAFAKLEADAPALLIVENLGTVGVHMAV